MQTKLFFYDQIPNRPTPKRYRKYNSVQAPVLSGSKSSPTSPTIVCLDQKPNFSDGPVRSNLLPEITQTYISLRNRLDSSLTNNEESQRQLYEQTKASSEKILDKLAVYLDNLPNLTELIPKSLEYHLMCGFKEFTENVVVVPRQWQTAAMKEQARHNLLAKKAEAAQINATLSSVVTPSNAETYKINCDLSVSDSLFRYKKRHTSSSLSDYGDVESKVSSANTRTTRERAFSKTGAYLAAEKSPNIHFSLTSASCWRKGYAVVQDEKSAMERREILTTCLRILQRAKETISHPNLTPTRIYYEDDNLPAKQRNNFQKKSFLKNPRRPALQKLSKPLSLYNVPMPNIPSMEFYNEDNGKTLFKTETDDDTSVIYYRSGNIAVVRFRQKDDAQGFSTVVFDDLPNRKPLLNFLPNGCGWCLHKNGSLRMFVSPVECYFFNENCTEVKHFTRGRDKMFPKTSYKVTKQIYFHCTSQANFILHLKLDPTKHFKFNLTSSISHGVTRLKPGPTNRSFLQSSQQETKELFLMTSGPFLSSFAKDLLRGYPPNQQKQPEIIQKQNRKSMDISEKICFRMPNESELQCLQKKARNIVNNWMRHYQVSVGLTVKNVRKGSSGTYQSNQMKQTCPAVETEKESLIHRDNKLGSICITITECDSKEKQRMTYTSEADTYPNKAMLTSSCNKLIPEKLANDSDAVDRMNKETFIQALEDVSKTARKLHSFTSRLRHHQVVIPPLKPEAMKSLMKCRNTLS